MATSTEEIAELIRYRGSIKQKLTLLEKFIDTIKAAAPDRKPGYRETNVRFETNASLLSDFDKLQSLIESKIPLDQLEAQYEERDKFQERYYAALAFLSEYLESVKPVSEIDVGLQQPSRLQQQPFSFNDSLQNVLLPKIKLPTFSGEFSQWLTFKINFTTTIANNRSLNSHQKFQFLKAALDGYALRIIEGLEYVAQPYQRAWDLLCDRFDKKQFLLDTHFKCIFNVQPLFKENYQQFRHMLDEVSQHLTALDGMEVSKETLYDTLIIHVLSNKLDKSTLREWKESKYTSEQELPTLKEFLNFLRNKADLLQSLHDMHSNTSKPSYSKQQFTKGSSQVHLTVSEIKCNFCKGPHTIYKCEEFLKLSIIDRKERVRNLNLCENCLRTGHTKAMCQLGPCRICKTKKHNSLLHLNNESGNQNTHSGATSTTSTRTSTLNMLVRPDNSRCQTQVLLSTAMVQVPDSAGHLHQCRVLLDCGAQSNLVSKKFIKQLNLPVNSTNYSIIGINQVVSQLNEKCSLNISSNCTNYTSTISCFVVPIITNAIPSYQVETSNWNLPQNIHLADSDFHISREVDLLIGASLFWDLILDGKIELGANLPILHNTQLGWIVSGLSPLHSNHVICNFTKIHIPEDEQLKRFWELEEVSSSPPVSKDDRECEQQFNQETIRNENGQFIVKLPLKHSPSLLGDSEETAIKRFKSLEKRFAHDLQFKHLYFQFIHEYKQLGHMSEIKGNSTSISYFLPHHGILKEQNITTKLRVVFDGSSPTSSGWSLNDLQYTGPKVQNDIFDILIRFRTYRYAVSADVSKMYRQILMHPDHRSLQQILWRERPEDEFSIFQLNTVTYGTRSAPYLAIKCIQQLAHEYSSKYTLASHTILNDFYVDDYLSGSDNLQELRSTCEQIYAILKSGNFILRKWISNDNSVISNLSHSNISNAVLSLGEDESCKTLGIQWLPKSDILKYNIKTFSLQKSITKRYILSTISQIYDPLGLLSPSIIVSKVIIQRLWSLKISWDSAVPSDLEKLWLRFQDNLHKLNQLSIPRNVIPSNFKLIDVHCFCDASMDAYAACVYFRSQNSYGIYSVQLMCAKSKVAPLKTISIPKLELCASLLGAQLMKLVKEAYALSVPQFFWSDSQVALCWIKSEPSLLQVFVSNRVSKIQSLTDIAQWKYVNTKENPADLASRGILPENLLTSNMWWTGPSFLKKPNHDWPIVDFSIPQAELPEIKKKFQVFTITDNQDLDLFHRYSNLTKLRRVTAFCLRFIHNLKGKNHRQFGTLTVAELEHANQVLIKLAQQTSFASEISVLSKNSRLPPKHKLSSLTPFLDETGIIRVGGRLSNTYLPCNIKHPVILSSKHAFTKLLFEDKHARLLHPGPQLLLASIRQFYWPIGGLVLAKRVLRNCIACFRCKPSPATYPMSSLPDKRIKPSLPFQITGIDYAGPFFILNKKGRGASLSKCYLAVFVCFCTKAVHLEIATDLTTDNFLACLRRFISRRGIPSDIYSDNGTTFVGAKNELKQLGHFLHSSQDSIVNHTSEYNIQWHFIPPYAPNFGGLWEAAVKSAKYHLKRVLINRNITYEEFNTLIIQVEGVLNSRPLFAMSANPNDLSPVTPSHFLIGRSIVSIPEPDLRSIKEGRLLRLKHIQQLYQQFWSQFTRQYVPQLHQQYKWKDAPSTLKVGSLALIRNDNQPPCKWTMGRIIRFFPGKDGISRVAEVRTSSGTIVRSIRHLCLLPNQEDIIN